MASISLSLDKSKTPMTAEVGMKCKSSVPQLFLCFATSLFSILAAFAFIEKSEFLASEFTILAYSTYYILYSLWNEEYSKQKHPENLDEEEASTLFSVASTSEENYKITFAPSSALQRSISMGFVSLAYLSAAFIVGESLMFSTLLLLPVYRTILDIARLWLSPQSRWFRILSRISAFGLQEETIINLPHFEEKSEEHNLLPSVIDEELESTKEKALLLEEDHVEEKSEESNLPSVMDEELESTKEKAPLFEEDQKSEKGEVEAEAEAEESDDQEWEELIYEKD